MLDKISINRSVPRTDHCGRLFLDTRLILCAKLKMASLEEKFASVQEVDIDDSGKFKYILIRIFAESASKFIVRGYDWAEFHADIYEQVSSGLNALGLTSECAGGGRIQHSPNSKEILVYGYSMGFGRADHQTTVNLLKKRYPHYKSITFSNDGY